MELEVGKFYIDNDECVYRCIAMSNIRGGAYQEAVLKLEGYENTNAIIFCVFYRSHYAWCDRENPDFKLVEEVEYFPHVVRDQHDS